MKVLNVLPGVSSRLGGPPAFVGGSVLELAKLDVQASVVATDLALAPWGWFQVQKRAGREELHPTLAGSDTEIFPARFPRRMAYSPGLHLALRREAPRYDVIHIHNLWQFPQYAAYRAAVQHDLPYVVSLHGGLDPFLRRRGRVRKAVTNALWQRQMLSRASLIHVTTDAERELTADYAPQVARAIVPCGLYTREFADLPPSDQFRRERLDGYAGPLIMFLGRVTEKKGVDVLIRAFAHARRACPCRLAIVGPDDSGLSSRLRDLATRLGVASEVTFVGPVYGEERLMALASADVWALSSHAENFGIAVVEAMAAGRAVVISRAVNLAAEVRSADAGLVTDEDPALFAQALVRVLADERLKNQLGQRARAFARRYDWRVVASELADMYRSATRLSG